MYQHLSLNFYGYTMVMQESALIFRKYTQMFRDNGEYVYNVLSGNSEKKGIICLNRE